MAASLVISSWRVIAECDQGIGGNTFGEFAKDMMHLGKVGKVNDRGHCPGLLDISAM